MTTHVQANVSVALDATGLGSNLTSSGASYVLTANDCGDSMAHLITIKGDAATDHSAKTFTIVGTDANGAAQSDGIAGPNGVATVTSTLYFLTVESVTPSASTGADTFDIGWTASAVGPTVHVNRQTSMPINIGIGCTVASGSPTYSLEYTYDGAAWFTHATITGKTASFDGSVTVPCRGLRMNHTAAGGVTATVIQHDNQG